MTASCLTTNSGVPLAMTWPWLKTRTRLVSVMMTSMMCSTMTMVLPMSWMRRTSAIAACSSVGVKPASDSSSSNRRGSVGSTRAISRRLRLGLQSGQFDDAAGVIARVVAMRMPQERADHHVLQHRHVFERDRHLEGTSDAGAGMNGRPGTGHVLAIEDDAATGRQSLAGEAIEEGRLAGAVRPDQADD